jgi:tape measure domain-containing protein
LVLAGRISSSLTQAFSSAQNQSSRLTSSLNSQQTLISKFGKGLSAGVIAMNQGLELAMKVGQQIGKVTEIVDEYASTTARLNMINDGLQTTKELQDLVYKSAQRSRGEYGVMASSVAKLNLLASQSFSGNREALAFTEMIQKSFTVAGASTQEMQAGIYQLTQAMAAGKLQGDEFRSIMENAPLVADAISKYLNIPKGSLKELSSEGLISSDIIKNSMFAAAEDINKKFQEMPQTFGQTMTKLQNTALIKFSPILEKIINVLNSPKAQKALEIIADLIGDAAKYASEFAKYISDMAPKFAPIVDKFKEFSPTLSLVIGYIKQLASIVGSRLLIVFNIVYPVVEKLIQKLLPIIISAMPMVISLLQKFSDMLVALAPTLKWLGGIIVELFTETITWVILPLFGKITSAIGGVMDFITGVFTGDWRKAWQGIKDYTFNLIMGIASILLTPFVQVLNFIRIITDSINSIQLPSWIPGIGGKVINMPKIPTPMAQGGTLTSPTFAMVAEAGYPETVIPHTNTARSRGLLAEAAAGVGVGLGMGNTNINVYVSGDVNNARQTGYDIANAIDEALLHKRRVAFG